MFLTQPLDIFAKTAYIILCMDDSYHPYTIGFLETRIEQQRRESNADYKANH